MIRHIKDKKWVRNKTNDIIGLSSVPCNYYQGKIPERFPCIIKPNSGHSKKGVSFVLSINDFDEALAYALQEDDTVLIEDYIPGKEISVETLSYNKTHYIIQITDKVTSGPPHFVELEHHQPADLNDRLKERISLIICRILDSIGFENGATHIELKIDAQERIYLIEVNPRGGGDKISDKLVKLSTGYDYIQGIIQVAMNVFVQPTINSNCFAGVYFLCQQTERLLQYFENSSVFPWIVEKDRNDKPLINASGNYDRSGSLIYASDHKIVI